MLLLAAPAAAQSVEREQLAVVGWSKACSVAVNHLGFPHRGEALYDEPVLARIGALTIAPGALEPEARWLVEWEGANTWKQDEARQAVSSLVAGGYDDPGFVEKIRAEPAVPERPELERIIRSTSTLGIRGGVRWPGAEWRLSEIHYNRTATCGLLVYESDRRFAYVLARLFRPKARPERARAHLSSGLLLFEKGDLEGALAETGIAAAMYPTGAANRYHHGAMLALSGELEKALEEVKQAVALDASYRKKAAEDVDLDNLRDLPEFKRLTSAKR